MNSNLIKQVNWNELLLAVLSLTPILASYWLYREPLLLNIGLVTISLFVPISRIKSGVYLATVQFFLIWLCFSLLFFTLSIPYLFTLICALMAFGTIFVTRYGAHLRTVANFIFIPALYLACELQENLQPNLLVTGYIKLVSFMPMALFSIVILLFIRTFFSYTKSQGVLFYPKQKQLRQHVLCNKQSFGEIKISWIKEAIAIFLGVIVAAFYVVTMHIAHGEWVIWSAAAVITGDLLSSKTKAQDRLIGLLSGISLGFFVAQFLPKTTLSYSLVVFAVMLTLIAFKNYRLAFGCRCFFIAIASYIATSTPQIALERVENVILGGMIGMAALYVCHYIVGYFAEQRM